jgi:hypothetical protein
MGFGHRYFITSASNQFSFQVIPKMARSQAVSMGNQGLQQPFFGGSRMFPISAIWLNETHSSDPCRC